MNDLEHIVRETADLPSVIDLNALVHEILEKTLSIVKADAGLLWEYDEPSNKLICKAYSGIASEMAMSLCLDVGEGLTGKTYLRGTPKLYSSMEEIQCDIADFSTENKNAMSELFYSKINSAYLMPIFVNRRIECILIIYRAQENNAFSPAEIETLKIFSELIEIALSNARSLITLQCQIGSLKRCNLLYEKLTHYAVDNSGISSIVVELGDALEAPVQVINLMSHEKYPQTGLINAKLSASLTSMNVKSSHTFMIESENQGESYCVYPIIADTSCLGYLLIHAKEVESPLKRMLLEVGRMVLAVELSKHLSKLDISYKRIAQSFSELISANNSESLNRKCAELGISAKGSCTVAIFAFLRSESSEIQESTIYRVIAAMKHELGSTKKLIFSSSGRIIALLCAQTASGLGAVHRQIEDMIGNTLKRDNLTLCAGLGSCYDGAHDIGKSYGEADKALSYQVSRLHGGLLQYSALGINQLFINLSSDEATAFLSSVLGPLKNQAKQSEYLETTLFTYIDSSYSLKQTAEKLFVHTNTLYQRLKKIETCLQISFSNPDDLLKLQLVRYLRCYYPDSRESPKP